jgi:anti-sigma-K factor RskA
MFGMNEEDDILAAEFALGLLDPAEAEAVQVRARTDAPLSLRIAWWRDQLAPLAREAEVPPPAGIWPRIETRLGANDNPRNAARPWQWATAGLGAVAAALLAVIVLRPAPLPQVAVPSPPPLVASITGDKGTAVSVSVDDAHGTMRVTPLLLNAGAGDAELWIIPVGETVPVSMGVFDTHGVTVSELGARTRLLSPGATFAISLEAKGGSPTGKAQGPIVATGKIFRS